MTSPVACFIDLPQPYPTAKARSAMELSSEDTRIATSSVTLKQLQGGATKRNFPSSFENGQLDMNCKNSQLLNMLVEVVE